MTGRPVRGGRPDSAMNCADHLKNFAIISLSVNVAITSSIRRNRVSSGKRTKYETLKTKFPQNLKSSSKNFKCFRENERKINNKC